MKIITKNIRHLRKLRGLTQEQLSEELGTTRSKIGSYEEGRSEPPIQMLINFSAYFKLPIDVLVKNDLTYAKDSSFIEVGNKRVLFPITVNEENEDLIEIVPAKASAGYLSGYDDPEYIQQLEKIKGDSMLPLKDGSYVVAKFVDDIREVKNGRTYVVVTANDGMTYKRIYNQIEERNALLLSPDNKDYQSYHVPITEVLELWEFTCAINTQEYDERDLKISSILKMFNDLKVELEAFTGKVVS